MKLKFLIVLFFWGLTTYQLPAQEINQTKLNDYLNYITKEKGEIGSLSIYKNGKEIYSKNFGQSNIDSLIYNKNTKYRIGSISKLFTATLIWKLIENHKLNLRTKLAKYFPNMPNASDITIKNLLEHSSGLGDYVMKENAYYWLYKPVKEKDILKEIRHQGVLFQPGDSVSYSNSGYYLLGKIVEQEYNKSYRQILQQQILKPLDIKNTASALDNPQNVFLPYLYNYSKGKWQKVKEPYYKNDIGVGGMVSTPQDLNQFITALFTYKILKKETLDKMKPVIGKETYGRGLMLAPFYQHTAFGHAGDITAYHATVTYNPKNHLAITFAINGSRYSRNNFAIDILNIIYGIDFTYPQFYNRKIPLKELKSYVGKYVNPKLPQELTFSIRQNVLQLKNPALGIPYIRLSPLTSNKFNVVGTDVKVEFHPKQNDLILYQGGAEFRMKRDVAN